MRPRKPLVTAILSVHNGEAHVRKALNALLAQSYEALEILVIDDGSWDGTPEALRACRDRRLRVITHAERRGLTASLSEGLAEARGTWIARLDADDFCHPDRIRLQMATALARPDCVLVSSACAVRDEVGRTSSVVRPSVWPSVISWQLTFVNPIAHSSVLFDRERALRSGGYDLCQTYAQDYDLWCRLRAEGEICVLPVVLTTLCKHPGQIWSVHRAAAVASALAIVRRNVEREFGIEADADTLGLLHGVRTERIYDVRATRRSLDLLERVTRRAAQGMHSDAERLDVYGLLVGHLREMGSLAGPQGRLCAKFGLQAGWQLLGRKMLADWGTFSLGLTYGRALRASVGRWSPR